MKKTTTIWAAAILGISGFLAQAQQGTVASGGDATGADGSVSYSVGQVFYSAQSGSNGSVSQGLQQAAILTVPTFNAVAPICAGSNPTALPTTSTNGITGSWSPALNNMATTTYTFTPDAGQQAVPATLQVVVNLTPIAMINGLPSSCGAQAVLLAHDDSAMAGLSSALRLNGTDQHVQMNDWNLGTNDWTAEAWIKPENNNGGYIISNRGNDFGAPGNWFVISRSNTGKLFMELGQSNHFYTTIEGNANIPLNQWSHVAVVRSGASFTFYVNGIKDRTFTETVVRDFSGPANTGHLGSWSNASAGFYQGSYDQVRIWTAARTPLQIAENTYKIISTPVANLVANYTMSENSGDVVVDIASGNNGQIFSGSERQTPSSAPISVPSTSYLWSNGATSQAISVTESGNYTVTITNAMGCSTAASHTISVIADPVVVAPAAVVVCPGQQITLTATGADTYQWSGGITNGVPFTPQSMTYTVVGTSGNCSATAQTIVTLLPSPTATLSGNTTICAESSGTTISVALSGTAPWSLTYTDGTTPISVNDITSSPYTFNANPAASATYSILAVTDAHCTAITLPGSLTVTRSAPLLTAAQLGANSPVCAGLDLNLTAPAFQTAGYTMNGNSGVAFIDISATGTTVPGGISDDSNHGISIPAFTFNGVAYTSATVSNNGVLVFGTTAAVTGYSNQILPSTEVNFTGSFYGALCVNWDDLIPTGSTSIKTQTLGDLFIVQWTEEVHISSGTANSALFQAQLNLSNGQIHFVYADMDYGNAGYNFGASATIGLSFSSASALQYAAFTPSLSNGQSISFTPNTVTYSWTGPNGFSANVQNPSIPAVTAANAGTYSLSVTNSQGCTSTASIAVAVNQMYPFYTDADADGYGTGTAMMVCADNATTPPAGYAVLGGDCNDQIAAIHPGLPEILYNGVDDNCNGQIDEGNQITTQLLPAMCGTTLTSMSSVIGITTLAPAAVYTGWRIRATNGAQVQILETNVPHFQMTQFASYTYATTYTIEIELQRNGVWLGYYGPACAVSTPAVLAAGGSAQVSGAQCGQMLAKINSLISTTSINGVTGYRFKVTNLTDAVGPYSEQILTRGLNWFTLQMLTRYNYGTTYRIEVAVKTTGDFGGYGAACEIYSPAAPALVNCGGTATSGTQTIPATSVQGVAQYRFQITRAADGASTTMDRGVNYFTFNQIPATIFTAGALYYVRVAVMTTNSWSPFGDACEIMAPGGTAKGDASENDQLATLFKATAYPNPYTTSFGIEVSSPSQEDVTVKVYDMLGKLLEESVVPMFSTNSHQLGFKYPAGVYHIVLSQNGTLRTLRVIKR